MAGWEPIPGLPEHLFVSDDFLATPSPCQYLLTVSSPSLSFPHPAGLLPGSLTALLLGPGDPGAGEARCYTQPEASSKPELGRQRGMNSPHLLFPNALSPRSGLSKSPSLLSRSCRALQLPQEYPVPGSHCHTLGGRPCFSFPADSGCSRLAAACPELLVGGRRVKPSDPLPHTVHVQWCV